MNPDVIRWNYDQEYIIVTYTEKGDSEKVILKYSMGDQNWQEFTDEKYPYEFSIHLQDTGRKLKLKWIAEDMNGTIRESEEFELRN